MLSTLLFAVGREQKILTQTEKRTDKAVKLSFYLNPTIFLIYSFRNWNSYFSHMTNLIMKTNQIMKLKDLNYRSDDAS